MKTQTKLIYIGERSNGEQLRACFIEEGKADKEENQLYFKRGKFFIGSKYKGEREDKNLILYPKALIPDEEVTDEELLSKWRMESHAARVTQSHQASKARVDKNPIPAYLIQDLRERIKNLSNKDAKAFLEYLVYEVVFKPMQNEMNKSMNEMLARQTKKKGKKK